MAQNMNYYSKKLYFRNSEKILDQRLTETQQGNLQVL